jgi:lipoprotein-releasing system ATP-binding protein
MIIGKHIKKKYGELEVLKGVDLRIAPSEIVSIVGSSGAGKTTLLTILGTLDKPSSGDIEFNGINIMSLSEKKLAQFRNQHIGFVFQFHHLLPEFTALENICIPAFINKISKKEAEQNASRIAVKKLKEMNFSNY